MLCRNLSYFVILAHFWFRKMEKMPKNAKFWTFWGQNGWKWPKNEKSYIKIVKPPRGSIWPKITFVDETGFSNCVETCFFNFRLETYDFRHFLVKIGHFSKIFGKICVFQKLIFSHRYRENTTFQGKLGILSHFKLILEAKIGIFESWNIY